MKSIMFKTKIFHEGKMYLLVSDVTKLMEISEKAFCKKYSDKMFLLLYLFLSIEKGLRYET